MNLSTRQLKVRIVESYGKKTAMLCDDEGLPFPCQTETRLDCSYEDIPKFTVTFAVDGELISLIQSAQE